MPTVHFGCHTCGVHFPNIDLAEQHLRQDHADTLEHLEKFDNGSHFAAPLMLLFTFECYTGTAHAAAIVHAKQHATTPAAASAHHRKRPMPADSTVAPKRGRLDPSVIDNSTRTQSVADSSNVTTTIFAAPITVRVTLCPHTPGKRNDVFTFPFARDKHTTVKKLLDAVAASYWHKRGEALVDLRQRRMEMHLSKKGVPVVGGPVFSDEDLHGFSDVQGMGWFGQLVFE